LWDFNKGEGKGSEGRRGKILNILFDSNEGRRGKIIFFLFGLRRKEKKNKPFFVCSPPLPSPSLLKIKPNIKNYNFTSPFLSSSNVNLMLSVCDFVSFNLKLLDF